ncbi:MAG TPA: peptidylprolyl isomerase [Polyangiaceae bacterium]|nr:peptidylprolyl isomerase [Polyangiaceae bacterium]
MSSRLAKPVRRAHWLGLSSVLLACQAAVPAKPATPAALAKPRQIVLCKDWSHTSHGPVCVWELTEEEQRHSGMTSRFEYEAGVVVRRVNLNGRGGREADEDDCSEYRYRYQQGAVVESTGYGQDGTVCDHTLFAAGASSAQLVDAWGRQVASSERMFTQERYERNAAGFLMRTRYFGRDGSPVSAPYTAHEVRFERDAHGRQTRRCFFDERGQATSNVYNVHCVNSVYDERGKLLENTFFDVHDQASESYIGSHRVKYDYDAFGNLTREQYLHLDGTPISTGDASCATVRYQYDERGFRSGADCLDGAGRPARWRQGNASWRASPDAQGHTREYRYFDSDGNPFERDSSYARYELDRDAAGHVTEWRYFLANGKPGQRRGPAIARSERNAEQLEVRRRFFDASGEPTTLSGCAVLETEYDQFRQRIRSTCRGANGELSANNDGTAITEWSYDAQGSVLETRFYDVKRRLGRSSDKLARQKSILNALGIETSSTRLAADGSVLQLPRFRALSVAVAQHDELWPARTRQASLSRIEAARAQLLAGLDFTRALYQFGDETVDTIHPGDIGYHDPQHFYSAARLAVEGLAVGQLSEIVEVPYGFQLYQRTE